AHPADTAPAVAPPPASGQPAAPTRGAAPTRTPRERYLRGRLPTVRSTPREGAHECMGQTSVGHLLHTHPESPGTNVLAVSGWRSAGNSVQRRVPDGGSPAPPGAVLVLPGRRFRLCCSSHQAHRTR